MQAMIQSRREFARMALGCALSAGTVSSAAQSPARTAIRKAVLITMLPKELSYADKFALARAAGIA